MSDKKKKGQIGQIGQIGKAIKSRALHEDEVRDFLILNPDFFDINRDLLTLLKPTRPKRHDDVVDFQAVLLDRLQHEVAALHDVQGTIIHASRSNMTTQARIHAAVLCLLEAENYDHLCHIVCHDWIDILQLDSIIICFEKDNMPIKDGTHSLAENTNVRLLEQGMIANIMGNETTAILRGNVTAAQEIYGPATPLVKAEALITIEGGRYHPQGILAFGSRDEEFFTPGQGTELLHFLTASFTSQLKNLLAKD